MTTLSAIDTAITNLESQQHRPVREYQIDPLNAQALARILAIDEQIQDLRNQRLLLGQTQGQTLTTTQVAGLSTTTVSGLSGA